MPPPGSSCRVHSPAKINLNLSVTGRREDNFHELCSIVCKTRFGDELAVEILPAGEPDRLTCSDTSVPSDERNLVIQALNVLRSENTLENGFSIHIEKRIPSGAGLGGGSGNAATLLKVLRDWFPDEVNDELCARVADSIGSDCRLFLHDGPCLMTGRGEVCESLPAAVNKRLSGQFIWLVCPDISISTPKAYSLFAHSNAFTSADVARAAVDEWIGNADLAWPRTGNDFERVLGQWMPSYSIVLRKLNELQGVSARLTGSGSAIFAMVAPAMEDQVTEILHKDWGRLKLLVRTLLE